MRTYRFVLGSLLTLACWGLGGCVFSLLALLLTRQMTLHRTLTPTGRQFDKVNSSDAPSHHLKTAAKFKEPFQVFKVLSEGPPAKMQRDPVPVGSGQQVCTASRPV